MRVFLAFLVLYAVEAASLEGEGCGRDLSLTCGSLKTAADCQAVPRCLTHVWGSQSAGPPVRQSKGCRFGQKLVKTIRTVINEQEGQITGEAAYLIASMCTFIADKAVRKECKELVTYYLPQILQLMNSTVAPVPVALLIGVCQPQENSTEEQHMAEGKTQAPDDTEDGDSPDCQLCHLIVDIETQHHANKPEQSIRHPSGGICPDLPPGLGSQCQSFFNHHVASLVVHMEQREQQQDPHHVCRALRRCQ